MSYDPSDDDTDAASDANQRDRSGDGPQHTRDPEERPTSARPGALVRRDYLRALGSVGAAGALGSLTASSSAAQGAFDEAAADQRIRETQQGPLTVEVVDQAGNPVSGAEVDVEMQEHAFDFGTALKVGDLLDQSGYRDTFRQHLQELFNTAVLENAHKWAIWEGDRQRADAAVEWLDQRDFRIRGHTCIYSVDYALPSDVQSAMNGGDGETVRQQTMQHLREIITHYGDQIQEWDVVNEVLHERELIEAIDGQGVTPETSDALADWYAEAESVIDENGLDVGIATNDYNTLTWPEERDRYPQQVRYLENQGVDVDVVGHQGHIGATDGSGQVWTFESVNQVFDSYADLPGTQKITEFDMTSGGFDDQQQRADVFRRFLKTAYGHPDVGAFVIWGMWDQTHWRDEAPFFYSDWSEKPALDVWRNLVLDEWQTDASGTTGNDGTVAVDAFLGEHAVTVSTSEETVTETVSVDDAGGANLVVQVAGGDEGPCADAPATADVEGQTVCDLDGDGNFRDVTGDGDLGQDDVVAFFDNQHRSAWKQDRFDFSGNGEVNQFDVVELFDYTVTN